MKNLFVGCRVRILYSDHWPELAGQEGRIYETGIYGLNFKDPSKTGKACWCVKPDSWINNKNISVDGKLHTFGGAEDQLEPILPEGMKPASWEDTVWKPDSIKEMERA